MGLSHFFRKAWFVSSYLRYKNLSLRLEALKNFKWFWNPDILMAVMVFTLVHSAASRKGLSPDRQYGLQQTLVKYGQQGNKVPAAQICQSD